MFKKIDPFKNIGLKLLALFLSLVLWLMVTNYNDPIIYKQFSNVPVRLLNTTMITDQDQVYKVLDGTDTIPTVTIGVARSIADNLTNDNVVATADVQDITQLDTVPITLTTNAYSAQLDSIRGSIENVKLDIESKKTASFTLQTTTSGTLADGYTLSDVTAEQNQVRVVGPESIVSSIHRAVANVDISNAKSTIVTYADIVLYGDNDVEIDSSELSMNIRNVRVTVNVLSAKRVPINFSTTGTPADGYLRNGTITANPSEVALKGRSSALAEVQHIEIPPELLNVSGRNSDLIQEVDITPYIPENLEFADESFTGIVEVTVGIEAARTREFSFTPQEIHLENVPDGYSAAVVTEGEEASGGIHVVLSGLEDVIGTVSPDFLTPRVNVGSLLTGDLQEDLSGTYSGTLQVTLPTQVVLQSASKVSVELTATGETVPAEQAPDAGAAEETVTDGTDTGAETGTEG